MKIRKSYLKQIIKEEYQRLHKESIGDYKTLEDYYKSEEGKNTQEYKLGRAELEETARDLRIHVSLLNNLKNDYQKASDKVTQIEKQAYEKYLKPVEDEIDGLSDKADQMMAKSDNLKTPQELKNFIVNEYRPFFKNTFRGTFKKLYPAMKNFYIQTKENGGTVSKPYLKIIIDRTEQQVKHLRRSMQSLDRFNV